MARTLQPSGGTGGLQRPPRTGQETLTMKEPTSFENFSTGFVKGGLSTIRGIGTIGQKVLDTVYKPKSGISDVYRPNTQLGQKITETLAPKNTAEKVGFSTEQFAEFFIPATKAAKMEQALNLVSKGMSKLPGIATRIGGKSAVQGLSAGLVRAAQTGGDIKETGKTALGAGIARGVFATIGEGARALKIPEKLYQTIFKNSRNDMAKELNANGIANIKKTNPAKYQDLVEKGIIVEQGGAPRVNNTLAEEALNRGLRGSIRDMSNVVVGGALDTEAALQATVRNSTQTVTLAEKQYINVLKKIAQEYEDVGFGETAKEAAYLASKLKRAKGVVSAEDALQLRRFFDRMRIASSFDKPASSLSTTQANFKTLADAVRGKINSVPGVSPLMKDYSFYIDALEALAREASRRGNSQVISLIDSIFLGGGLSTANPAPVLTIGIFRRILNSPQGMTLLGSLMNKSTASPTTLGVIGGASQQIQKTVQSE